MKGIHVKPAIPGRLLSVLAWLALAIPAGAQVQRTFVSTRGNDSHNCSFAAPCRTFGKAMSITNDGGDIVALDSGGYGPFTITKSVNISGAPGVLAAIAAPAGAAITVNAPNFDTVILRNLALTGNGGTTGIDVPAVSQIQLLDCSIRGFVHGIDMRTAAGANLHLENVVIKDCTTNGLKITGPAVGIVEGALDDVLFLKNGNGIFCLGGIKTTVRRSLFHGNTTGVRVNPGATKLNIDSCVFHANTTALQGGSAPLSVIHVGNSDITDNATGMVSGGNDDIQTFGDNRVVGNGAGNNFFGVVAYK